jgi:hypothetical protein
MEAAVDIQASRKDSTTTKQRSRQVRKIMELLKRIVRSFGSHGKEGATLEARTSQHSKHMH